MEKETARWVALRLEEAVDSLRDARDTGERLNGFDHFHFACAAVIDELYRRLLDPIYGRHPGLEEEVSIAIQVLGRRGEPRPD